MYDVCKNVFPPLDVDCRASERLTKNHCIPSCALVIGRSVTEASRVSSADTQSFPPQRVRATGVLEEVKPAALNVRQMVNSGDDRLSPNV